jgi:predicted TIM-barrel fold metal-dependent hydrolase
MGGFDVVSGEPANKMTEATSATAEYADCDIHPRTSSQKDLYPFLTKQWQDFIEELGTIGHAAFPTQTLYTRSQPGSVRRDAWSPDGDAPGTSVAFMGRQHLDVHNIKLGCLMVTPPEAGHRNPDYAAAYCSALNDWLKVEWMQKDRRLRGSIAWPANNIEAAVAEIERRAGDRDFVQIEALSRSGTLYGD